MGWLASVVALAALASSTPAGEAGHQAATSEPVATTLEKAVEDGDVAAALVAAESRVAALETERAADPLLLAAGLEEVADLLRSLQKPEADDRAETLLRRGLRLREEVQGPDRVDQASTMERLSELYFYAGRWTESEALDRRVLAIRKAALGPDHADVAESEQNLALNLYYHARYREAEPLLRDSLRIYERLQPAPPLELAYALNYLAEDLRAQNKYAEAEPLFDRALRVAEAGVTPAQRLVLIGNLSGLYRDTQRFAEAQWYARQAVDLADRLPEVPAAVRLSYVLNLAELYRLEGNPDLAAPVYERALALARESFRPDHPRIGTVLNQMAVNLAENGSLPEAEALLRESMGIKVKEWGPDAPDLANTHQDLGRLLERLGRRAEAEAELRRALAIREERLGPLHPSAALSLLALAELLEAAPTGQTEALALLDRSIRILDATPAEPRAHARAYARRAALRHDRGEREAARNDLARALAIVEGMRPEAGGGEWTRARFLAQYADDYQRMVGWRIDAGDLEGAIRYAERGRGRVLLDQLAVAGVDLRAGIEPEERRGLEAREADVRARLAEYAARLEKLFAQTEPAEEARAQIASLEKEQALAVAEFERLYQEIRNASTLWRGSTGLGSVVGLAEIQREVVPRSGLVLYYSVGEDRSFLFVIPPPGRPARAVALSIPPTAAADLGVAPGPLTRTSLRRILAPDGPGAGRGVLAQLAAPPRPASQASLDARLHALFEILLPSTVWPRVRGAAEVVVVPDDLVHQLPFETLVVSLRGADGSSLYWLDEGPVVRYAASATVAHALALRKAPSRADGGILSVSDPIFDRDEVRRLAASAPAPALASASRPDGPAAVANRWELARLPGTAREAEAIRAAFEGAHRPIEMLRQLEAREGLVRSRLPSARYIHMATHGVVDERGGGLFAALALTPSPEAAGPDDDGQLQLFEIYGLELGAELAVLSSCETRVGTVVPGEGVFALSRAFLVAGVRRVVASLWPADDEATALLMASFFRAVARGERRGPDYARALAVAKAEVRRRGEWSAPFFWAPFVLDGAR